MRVFTIGFTQKTAENFFGKLKEAGVQTLVDIRLNNKSQLAGFAKYPDICFFLRELCSVEYVHDIQLAPNEQLLKNYRGGKINWQEYVTEFNDIMEERNIMEYIRNHYNRYAVHNICFLCSEPKPEQCHRSLIAERFRKVFGADIVNL